MLKARVALGLALVLLASAAVDAAPVLTLRLQATKGFQFSWTGMGGITYYRMLEDPTGSSGFTQIGATMPATRRHFEHIVPLYRRVNARYIVQACNALFCIDSNTVHASGPLTGAIGYFKASNVNSTNDFGDAVALSADGTTLAVGAPRESSRATGVGGNQADTSLSNAGAVYVFRRFGSGSAWVQQAYIKASNTGELHYFGKALALSSDGSTLAVGATGEDVSAKDAGAVYVYVRVQADWSQQAYLKASNPGERDSFGSALSLSGDGNTLAVGAPFEDSGARGANGDQSDNSVQSSGAVYVWTRSGATWSQEAYIKASNPGVADWFGTALDLSLDGLTLVVSAVGEASRATGVGGDQADDSTPNAGAVYVYERVSSLWTQQAYIKASNTSQLDQFGGAVALSGNGAVLAVGAIGEDSRAIGVNGDQADSFLGADSGAVYVFERAGSGWAQQAYIKASNTSPVDRFGWAVALSNDGSTLVVGAPHENGSAVGINGDQTSDDASASGAAYLFAKNNGLWTQRAYLKASNTLPDPVNSWIYPAFFGRSLALARNAGTLAVGAPYESGGSPGINGPQVTPVLIASGAVYVY